MFNNSLTTLFEFIISLSVLLFIHELGHFLVGRLLGIHAEEFGFGYPPKVIKLFTWKGTDFTINLIPFGAFVRFKGEDNPSVEGGLYNANKWKRLATLLAGPAMNLIAGVLLFSFVVSQVGIPKTDVVEIIGIAPDSPAEQVGLRENDIIFAINQKEITDIVEVGDLVRDNLGDEVIFTVMRDNVRTDLQIIPRVDPPEGEGAVGIIMQNPIEEVGFFRSLPYGGRIAFEQGKQIISLPGMLIRGDMNSEEARMLSPIGVYGVYSQIRQIEQPFEQDDPLLKVMNVAWFFGIITISLGFSNLLPIPALDGGRILFILPEIFFGKRVPAKYENIVHLIGYSGLLILMGYIFFQDIINPVVIP